MAGEIERLPVATLASGQPLEVVLHRRRGRTDGPRLAVIAGIHGDEPLGVETARQFLESLDGEEFRGEVVAIPLGSPLAFAALTRASPPDMANLNRVFPGDPNGTVTEQLARVIVDHLLPGCDALIDLHSGGNLATVDYVYMHDDGPLSLAFGCELLYRYESPAGTLGGHARYEGVSVVVSELGGGQQLNEHYIEKGVRGIRNVMKALGMLDGVPDVPERQTIVDTMTVLRPHHGGLMLSSVSAASLGDQVSQGFQLARVVDPATFETLEVIEAPYDPTLLVLVREPVTKIDPGDYGFIVADGASATFAGGAG